MSSRIDFGSVCMEDSIDSYCGITDLQFKLIQANRLFREAFGLSAGEYADLPLTELVHLLEPDKLLQAGRKCLQHPEKVINIEAAIQSKEGKKRNLHWEISTVAGEDGMLLGILFKAENLSNQEQNEALLFSLVFLLEDISDAVISMDLDFKIKTWNRAATSLFGISRKEWAGKTTSEISGFRHLDDTEENMRRKLLRDYSRKGKAVFIKKDGEKIYVDVQHEPVNNERGEIIGFVMSCRNIQPSGKSGEQNDREFQTLSENIPVAIYEYYFNKNGTHGFKYLSPSIEKLFGIPVNDFVASYNHLFPEDRPLLQERILHSQQTNEPFYFEGRVLTLNGLIKWHKASSSFAFETDNGTRIFTGIIMDITEQKIIEEKYRNEERRFGAIFNSMFQFMGLMNPDGTILEANQTSLDFGGVSLKEVVGKPIWETYWCSHDPQAQQLLKEAVQIAAQGAFIRYEATMRGKDHASAIVDFSIKPVKDEQGNVTLLIPEGRNITEQKAAKKALESTEARFRDLTQSVPGVIYQWFENYDGSFGFSYVSPKLKDYFSFPPEEINKLADLIHPEDKERWRRSIDEANKNETPWEFEGRLLYPDNTVKWWKGASIMSEKNEVGRVYNGIMLDITTQKEAQEKTKHEERRFRAIFNSMFQFMGLLTPEGLVIEINQTALDFAGLRPSDVVGKYFWETPYWTISPFTQIQLKQSIQSAAKGEFIRYEVEIKGKEDEIAWIDFSLKPLKDEQGNVVLLIPEGRNINDHRMLQERLSKEEAGKNQAIIQAIIEAQEKEREEISYELHDNVNQILSIGKLMLEMAENQPAKMLEGVQQTKHNIQKAIEEIRKLSHSLNPATLKLVGLIDAIKDILGNIQTTGKLSIKFDHTRMKEAGNIDSVIELAIFRIVQEQLNNIIRHSGATKVTIKLKQKAGLIHLEIADNGKGFDATTTKKGLGLNNIFNRVEHYKGNIKLETTRGKGCVLAAVLPMKVE